MPCWLLKIINDLTSWDFSSKIMVDLFFNSLVITDQGKANGGWSQKPPVAAKMFVRAIRSVGPWWFPSPASPCDAVHALYGASKKWNGHARGL